MQELILYIPGILLSYAAHLLTVVSPGPNVFCLMGTSMSVGRQAGMVYALGVSAGTLTWGVLSVVGLAALLSTYAIALYAIKILGGMYLLWLAYKAFKSSLSAQAIEAKALSGANLKAQDYFKRAYIINMTNPKAALGWVAIVSLGMEQGAPVWVGLMIILGTFINSLFVHLLFATAFSSEVMSQAYGKVRRLIQASLGLFFTFAGFKLLTTKPA